MNDWKTTVCGIAAALPQVITGIINKDWAQVATGIATLLIGVFAKDSVKVAATG